MHDTRALSSAEHIDDTSSKPAEGEPNTLWKAAYEHPGYAALAVAGVAAGAALLWATRGHAAKLSPFARKNVLLVEDGPFGEALEWAAKQSSSRLPWVKAPHVTRVSGITSVEPFTAVTAQGKSIVLDPSRFDVALVNGLSGKGHLEGPAVVKALRQHNVTSIATTISEGVNKEMLQNGASLVVPKGTVLPALMDGRLNFRQAINSPARLQSRIDLLTAQLKNPHDPLRKQADGKLMEFLR